MNPNAKFHLVKGLIDGASLNKTSFRTPKQATVTVDKPAVDNLHDSSEWYAYEDWTILQVIQNLQGLPLSLKTDQSVHIPNWDLAADLVNAVSPTYRSPQQCRLRYENVIAPREEEKILHDTYPKEPKKTEGISETKGNMPTGVSRLHLEECSSFTSHFANKFEAILAIAKLRPDVTKHCYTESDSDSESDTDSKHTDVLAERGINFDPLMTPVQLAETEAECVQSAELKCQERKLFGVGITKDESILWKENKINSRPAGEQKDSDDSYLFSSDDSDSDYIPNEYSNESNTDLVVSAAPTLSASLQPQPVVDGKPEIACNIEPQMITSSFETLNSINTLDSCLAVLVGQQQTPINLQQVAASSPADLTEQQSVTDDSSICCSRLAESLESSLFIL